jgi:hypothetical protein
MVRASGGSMEWQNILSQKTVLEESHLNDMAGFHTSSGLLPYGDSRWMTWLCV